MSLVKVNKTRDGSQFAYVLHLLKGEDPSCNELRGRMSISIANLHFVVSFVDFPFGLCCLSSLKSMGGLLCLLTMQFL